MIQKVYNNCSFEPPLLRSPRLEIVTKMKNYNKYVTGQFLIPNFYLKFIEQLFRSQKRAFRVIFSQVLIPVRLFLEIITFNFPISLHISQLHQQKRILIFLERRNCLCIYTIKEIETPSPYHFLEQLVTTFCAPLLNARSTLRLEYSFKRFRHILRDCYFVEGNSTVSMTFIRKSSIVLLYYCPAQFSFYLLTLYCYNDFSRVLFLSDKAISILILRYQFPKKCRQPA